MHQNKGRMIWIDQLRSAAILLVILGHVSLPSEVNGIIYSFHMPLFFIITGLTIKPQKLLSINLREYTGQQIKQLLIPYFWMNFMMYPIWYLAYHYLGKSKVTIPRAFLGILAGNAEIYQAPSNALWFVLVLMLAKILYTLLLKLSKENEKIMQISIFLCAVIGFFDRGNVRIWHFNVVFTAVVFIYVGNCMMQWYQKGGDAVLQEIKKSIYALILLFLVAVGVVTAYFNGRISMNANLYGRSVLLFYITAIAFSSAGMLFAIKFSTLKIKFASLITYIGKNTLLYVGVHIPILRVLKKLFPDLLAKYRYNIIAAVVLYFGIALLCLWFNRAFPFVCGKKSDDKGKKGIVKKSLYVMWCVSVPYFYLVKTWGIDLSNWSVIALCIVGLGICSVIFTLCASRFFPIIFNQSKNNKELKKELPL